MLLCPCPLSRRLLRKMLRFYHFHDSYGNLRPCPLLRRLWSTILRFYHFHDSYGNLHPCPLLRCIFNKMLRFYHFHDFYGNLRPCPLLRRNQHRQGLSTNLHPRHRSTLSQTCFLNIFGWGQHCCGDIGELFWTLRNMKSGANDNYDNYDQEPAAQIATNKRQVTK